jgi:hypothetical protein
MVVILTMVLCVPHLTNTFKGLIKYIITGRLKN